MLIELAALTMTRKSLTELREARQFRADSLPREFPVDPATGEPLPNPPRTTGAFSSDLVRARRVHLEDWLALIAFNHLFAGAEAFVSANLWDLPAQVSPQTTSRGAALRVTVRW